MKKKERKKKKIKICLLWFCLVSFQIVYTSRAEYYCMITDSSFVSNCDMNDDCKIIFILCPEDVQTMNRIPPKFPFLQEVVM